MGFQSKTLRIMRKWPELKNAPVQEAILDIKFTLPTEIAANAFENFIAEIITDFPTKKAKYHVQFSGTIELDKEDSYKSSKQADGFILNHSNGKEVMMIGANGFSYHVLEPYPAWPYMYDQAKKYWDLFAKYISNPIISRIGLRYINRMEFPFPSATGFSEYIALLPFIPEGIPQTINSFFLQLNIPNATNDLTAIVNETFEPPKDGFVKFYLDIDTFKPYMSNSSQLEFWNDFEFIRDFKNQIFFNAVTEKTIQHHAS